MLGGAGTAASPSFRRTTIPAMASRAAGSRTPPAIRKSKSRRLGESLGERGPVEAFPERRPQFSSAYRFLSGGLGFALCACRSEGCFETRQAKADWVDSLERPWLIPWIGAGRRAQSHFRADGAAAYGHPAQGSRDRQGSISRKMSEIFLPNAQHLHPPRSSTTGRPMPVLRKPIGYALSGAHACQGMAGPDVPWQATR